MHNKFSAMLMQAPSALQLRAERPSARTSVWTSARFRSCSARSIASLRNSSKAFPGAPVVPIASWVSRRSRNGLKDISVWARRAIPVEPLPQDLRVEVKPEDGTNEVEYDAANKVVRVPKSALGAEGERQSELVTFKCDKCDTTSAQVVNPEAFEKGVVFGQCSNCKSWHLLAANKPSLPAPPEAQPTVPVEPLPKDVRIEVKPEDGAADVEYDAASKVVRIPLSALGAKSQRRSKLVMFTCNQCGARTARLVNPVAWEKGVVFGQCSKCKVWHVLSANNPKIFEEIRYREDPKYNEDVDP